MFQAYMRARVRLISRFNGWAYRSTNDGGSRFWYSLPLWFQELVLGTTHRLVVLGLGYQQFNSEFPDMPPQYQRYL